MAGIGSGEFLKKGIAKITEATALDNQVTESGDTKEGRYGQAINLYMQGIEYFNYALKRECNAFV